MKTSRNSKWKQQFRRYMQEKLAITVVVIMLALFALVAVLYHIISKKGADYNQIVLGHQDYESRTVPYKRGSILDRNGTVLATSEKVYNLVLDPKQILDEDDNYHYLDPTLDALVECFGYDREELKNLINNRSGSAYVVYAKQLSAEEKDNFENYERQKNEEYRKASVDQGGRNRIAGVWFEDEYKRIYPYNNLACNVIGFALHEDGASGGVEQYYNSELTGIDGREFGYLNDQSNPERTVKQAVNGNDLELTLDTNLQQIVQKYIDEWQAGTGSDVAACIMMDPNNGEVLAMDTSTRYDLNNPYDLTGRYTQEQIDAMDANAKADAWYQIWRNFCVNDTYEPGSPQKAFTVAGAMEEGVISGNESYDCEGSLNIGGWNIHCVSRTGHGALTVTQGLMKSCNVVMMNISRAEGTDRFLKYQKIFGFGEKTGIDLPGEADTSGLVYNSSNINATSLATNSFGQNYNCTMIQMAAAYASLINGGSYYRPHVLKKVLNEDGAVVKKNDPVLVRETVSQKTVDFIHQALDRTVNDDAGTAKAARIAGYKVAGKTGTAQKQPRSANNYLVSFMGFVPAYDPQVLCYVVIDTPHLPGQEQAHSTFAQEVFTKIMTEALPYLNVFPEGSGGVTAEDSGLAGQDEGIISAETAPETQAPAPTLADGSAAPVYDDEYIDDDPGYQVPDNMPTGGTDESPEAETEANQDAEAAARAAAQQGD